ncbi:MAG TPA: hypothetical protein VKF62_03740 [Planctomycetota bacterium]|nr:hypothetical protein [Planctomycetota bacterium]
MTEDDELTPEEQAAIRSLPREADPPPALEERVVAGLRDRGLVAPRRRWTGMLWRGAAAVALFAAGVGAGRVTATRSASSEGSVFLLLLYAGPEGRTGEADRVREYGSWAASLRREGKLLEAERLGSEYRVLGGSAEASPPRGYFLFRASGMDEALEIARTCPHLRHGGRVSVQPLDPV